MRLITPSSFPADPDGYAGNFCGHVVLGAGSMLAVCYASLYFFGELPYKAITAKFLLVGYLLGIELLVQWWKRWRTGGWKTWDTVEDTIVFGYGVVILYSFNEVERGSDLVQAHVWDTFPVFMIAGVHLFIGTIYRYIRLRNGF